MEKTYNKLVRDNIPDIIRNNGQIPITRVLDNDEYKLELEKKLYEEYKEVIDAKGINRIEELADMLEVISALAILEGRTLEDINLVAKQKKLKRGSFEKRIFLERVKVPEHYHE